MNRPEPPSGPRMLERLEAEVDAVERERAASKNAATDAQQAPAAKPRRTPRKRRKPFVL